MIDSLEIMHFKLSIIHFTLSIIQYKVYNRQFEVYNRQFESTLKSVEIEKKNEKKYVALIRCRIKQLPFFKLFVLMFMLSNTFLFV